ncbi:MAG TPA: hypothetical protein VE136_06220 [Anaerolineales bacterium]|nr:hypothetical protein [Anaerolineales bacterium]
MRRNADLLQFYLALSWDRPFGFAGLQLLMFNSSASVRARLY